MFVNFILLLFFFWVSSRLRGIHFSESDQGWPTRSVFLDLVVHFSQIVFSNCIKDFRCLDQRQFRIIAEIYVSVNDQKVIFSFFFVFFIEKIELFCYWIDLFRRVCNIKDIVAHFARLDLSWLYLNIQKVKISIKEKNRNARVRLLWKLFKKNLKNILWLWI